MINIETLSPKAHRVTVMGPFHYADAEGLVAFAKERLASGERGNLLIDVTSLADFSFSAISDQLMHIPSMLQFVYSLDRIAFISDEEWMRSAARLESMLLPGVTYQVYDDDEVDAALAWVLEEEDEPHKGAFRELELGRTAAWNSRLHFPKGTEWVATARMDTARFDRRGFARQWRV